MSLKMKIQQVAAFVALLGVQACAGRVPAVLSAANVELTGGEGTMPSMSTEPSLSGETAPSDGWPNGIYASTTELGSSQDYVAGAGWPKNLYSSGATNP
jgi:hypothetical protein